MTGRERTYSGPAHFGWLEVTMRTGLARILLFLLLGLMAMPGLDAVSAQTTTKTTATTKTVNVELILDSSGSMAERLDSGQTRIEAAKQVLTNVIGELPEQPNINVGFRVYGHKGNNTEAGKSVSCRSTELKVPIKGVDKKALQDQVNAYQPVGWTPLSLSLREAGKDFPEADANTVNAVVLVTDGLETCGGDPCSASRQIKTGASAITTHVIGFALDETERANLQCIVDESGGLLLGAGDADELSAALFTVLEELQVVVKNGFIEIESIGGVFPKAKIDGQAEVTDSNPSGGEPFSTTLTTENRVEVPAGSYDVHWQNPSGAETHITVTVEPDKTAFIRGSIFRFPHGGGEVYRFTDLSGVIIWEDQIEFGDAVWVLPGVYRLQITELTGTPILLSMDVQTLPGEVTEVQVLTAP
jgi:hypothetical protein